MIPWDQMTCREIIDRLRDGQPPYQADAVEFLSVGYEDHLARAKAGLETARTGGYDITILVGPYGIGKSHFLRRVEVLAQKQNFVVSRIEIGGITGERAYFNKPDAIYHQIAGSEKLKNAGYKGWSDEGGKFVGKLRTLASIHKAQGKSGLTILLDEGENTFNRINLPNYRSRYKAYRFLDALFRGYVQKPYSFERLELKNICIVLAITPGVIESATNEPDGWRWGNTWVDNPAKAWNNDYLPERLEIAPLSDAQALKLAERILEIHGKALDWNAAEYVSNDKSLVLCQEWCSLGTSRDERQLVKRIIEELEIAEQNR